MGRTEVRGEVGEGEKSDRDYLHTSTFVGVAV